METHRLEIRGDGTGRCVCGEDLAVLMPRYPRLGDAEKAFGLHLMAVADEVEA